MFFRTEQNQSAPLKAQADDTSVHNDLASAIRQQVQKCHTAIGKEVFFK